MAGQWWTKFLQSLKKEKCIKVILFCSEKCKSEIMTQGLKDACDCGEEGESSEPL